MPARRRKQSNAMLYTLIIFVGLFIAATTVAVIYFVNAEKYRTERDDLQTKMNNYATEDEQDQVGTDVGTKLSGKTWLGTMMNHLDEMDSLIVGGVAENTSAEVKVNQVNTQAQAAFQQAQKYITITDPNTMGLIPLIEALIEDVNNVTALQTKTQTLLDDKLKELDDVNKSNFETQQTLLADKAKLVQDVETAQQDYQNLKDSLSQSTSEQIRNLTDEKDNLTATKEDLEKKLALKEAELAEAQQEIERAKAEVAKIAPGPDQAALAYKPDGTIIMVDNEAKIVHLNIGINDHVYRGLTFTVYDRGTSIPPDGKGKAEIKVFDIAPSYSSARITNSEVSQPILIGDIVANLIWDSSKPNVFVIGGDFDLNGDGYYDYDAAQQIAALIEKWGGKVDPNVTIDTDFVVLGQTPQTTEMPSPEEQRLDPTALGKYKESLKRLDRYNFLQERAQALWIPIFTYDKFLYFIGYKTQANQAGAFQ
jgi:hypothetical protein